MGVNNGHSDDTTAVKFQQAEGHHEKRTKQQVEKEEKSTNKYKFDTKNLVKNFLN